MLFEVDDVSLLDIEDIEDTVGSGGSTVVDGQQHEAFICDDLVEMGVVEPVVAEFAMRVGCLEEGEDFGLFGYLQHGWTCEDGRMVFIILNSNY